MVCIWIYHLIEHHEAIEGFYASGNSSVTHELFFRDCSIPLKYGLALLSELAIGHLNSCDTINVIRGFALEALLVGKTNEFVGLENWNTWPVVVAIRKNRLPIGGIEFVFFDKATWRVEGECLILVLEVEDFGIANISSLDDKATIHRLMLQSYSA